MVQAEAHWDAKSETLGWKSNTSFWAKMISEYDMKDTQEQDFVAHHKTSEILRSDQHTRSSSEILRSDQHTQNFLCTTHCLIYRYTLHIFITTTWFLYKLHCRHLGRQSELVSCTSALVGINNAAQYTVCHLHEVALLTNAVWRVKRSRTSWTLLTILLEQSCDLNAIQHSLPHYNGKYTVECKVYTKKSTKERYKPDQHKLVNLKYIQTVV